MALCNVSGLPEHYAWLGVPGIIYQRLKDVPFKPALSVVLDCGDAARIGHELAGPVTALPCINLDHHLGNPHFGNLDNWVEPRMAATGQMVAALLAALDVPLRGDVAEAVYVAVSTDSGGFTFDNVTAEIFELTAHLVRQGLDVAAVRRHMDNQWSLPRMRLWGRLMSSFTQEFQGRVALAAVSLAELATLNADKQDLEGFAEHMRRLKGVEVAALLREDAPTRCKISLRSSGPQDVRRMAEHFGGGVHRNAAGATLPLPLDKATAALLEVVGKGLADNANTPRDDAS